MGDFPPYQPTLLSLQDMLNIPEDEDEDSWTNNPYNISNFFEPIISPTKTGANANPLADTAQPGTSASTSVFGYADADFVLNPFFSPVKAAPPPPDEERKGGTRNSPVKTLSPEKTNLSSTPVKVKAEWDEDHETDFLRAFEEALVQSELREAGAEGVDLAEGPDSSEIQELKDKLEIDLASPVSVEALGSPSVSFVTTASVKQEIEDEELKEEEKEFRPTLKVVTSEKVEVKGVSKSVPRPKTKAKPTLEQERLKAATVKQLDEMIAALKRYSKLLENFLNDDGDLIMEHYSASDVLKGILPECDEVAPSTTSEREHPLEMAHSITRFLIEQSKGPTPLSTLPPQRAHVWRSSELISLQQTILESVISRREFLLNCRYTELLTEMGFDFADLRRLQPAPTREAEQRLMTAIVDEHDLHSKLTNPTKQPIQTFVIREAHGTKGIPRVFWLPSPKDLVDDKWRCLRAIRYRTVWSTIKDEDIDWLYVMKKLVTRNPGLRSIDLETCRRTYEHFLSPKTNNSCWQLAELKKLRTVREKYPGLSWAKIADLLETRRTPFSCFVKYKFYCFQGLKSKDYTIPTAASRLIKDYLEECGGDVLKLETLLVSSLPRKQIAAWMAPRRLVSICQKQFNPRIKKGRFSLVEDALLLVVMEKCRDHLLEGACEPLSYALPWRYITYWKVRFGVLMTTFYFKNWSLEDDRRLLKLVEDHGANFKLIQRSFPSKNRKQCRERYVRLRKALRTTTLEDYHLLFISRKKGFYLQRLNKIAKFLDSTIQYKRGVNKRFPRPTDLEFLKSRRIPWDSELKIYLLTFPLELLASTLCRLSNCLLRILDRVEEYMGFVSMHGEEGSKGKGTLKELNQRLHWNEMIGFDRRKFDPKCPASIANALQIRNAKLLPIEKIDHPTPFEQEIYHCYKYFSLKGKMKNKIKRGGIPALEDLRKLSSISRILEPFNKPFVLPGLRSNEDEVVQPSFIVPGPASPVAEKEEAFLQELEERKKGGRRKGVKRKRTAMREQKRLAAMKRWQKKTGEQISDELTSIKTETDYDDVSEDGNGYESSLPQTPATPSTPGSSIIFDGELETDSVVSGCSINSIRKAALAFLGDHAYIAPMENPAEFSSLPLPQLFSKICEVQVKREPAVTNQRAPTMQQNVAVKVERELEESDSSHA